MIRVYSVVCHSVCIFWTHNSMVEPHCSTFRIITAIFRVSESLGNLPYSVGHILIQIGETFALSNITIKQSSQIF